MAEALVGSIRIRTKIKAQTLGRFIVFISVLGNFPFSIHASVTIPDNVRGILGKSLARFDRACQNILL